MRRLVIVVSAIVFVDTAFYAVVAPLLPTYADDHHLSKASAGILLAAYPAGTLIGALPSGLLAGRIGARATVLAGLALLGASSLGFAFADAELTLDASRFVQGIGGACSWAGGLAWIVGAAPPDRRGELIGVALSAAIGGALLGPVAGAAAAAIGPRPIFASAAVLAAGLALVATRLDAPAAGAAPALAAPAPGAAPALDAPALAAPGLAAPALAAPGLAAPALDAPAPGAPGPVPHTGVGRTLRGPRVAGAMWLVALPGLGFGAIDVLVPLRLDDLGATETAIAAAFLVAAGAEALVSPVVGRLSDRRGRHVPIRVGLVAAAVLMLVLPLPASAPAAGALLVAVTAALGAFWAPAMALLSDAAEAVGAHQGLAFGLVNLAWAIGMVLGSAGGGAAAKATSDAVVYGLLAVLCLATLAALARGRAPYPAAAG